MPDRFPQPWKSELREGSFVVVDAHGFALAYVYFGDQRAVGTGLEKLTRDQARRVASNIAKLPALLRGEMAKA